MPLEQKPKLCIMSMVSLREIIYLHTYPCRWSEVLKNSLCQFCLLYHCPPCTDGSSWVPTDLAPLLTLSLSPDAVRLAACDLSVWKTLMSVSFGITESTCVHLDSGLQFMCMWVFGLAERSLSLCPRWLHMACVRTFQPTGQAFLSLSQTTVWPVAPHHCVTSFYTHDHRPSVLNSDTLLCNS